MGMREAEDPRAHARRDGWISQSRLGAGEGFMPKFRRKHMRPTEGRTASLTTRRESRCTTTREMTRRRAGATGVRRADHEG